MTSRRCQISHDSLLCQCMLTRRRRCGMTAVMAQYVAKWAIVSRRNRRIVTG